MSDVPNEAPPSYEAARRGDGAPPASSGTAAASQSHDNATASSGNQRTPQRQSSMDHEIDIEQEDRPLPPGWVPQFSEEHERFFFVDTLHRGGPRAIWVHPLDDPEWLQTVPRGMDPLAYVDKLWQEHPEPSPEPSRSHLPSQQPQQHQQQQQQHSQSQQPFHGGEKILISSNIPGVSANTQAYLSTLGQPGTREGTRIVSKDELVQVTLNKMGTPEEYERKNPPSGASKLFHRKESAAQRQRRHAEHKANDLADALAYRQPYNPPLMRPSYYGPATVVRPGYGYGGPYGGGMYGGGMYGGYGYPGYNRGYGARYPGMGMSGAFLGLGAGALLGGALF